MKRHNEPSQVKTDLTPSNGELDRLRAAMEYKTQERQNGRLQSAFFQVMYEWDVLRMNEWGEPVVRDPYTYTKWNQAHHMIEKSDRDLEDSFFAANPEKKAEAKERFQSFIKETRESVFGVSRNMRLTNQETGV